MYCFEWEERISFPIKMISPKEGLFKQRGNVNQKGELMAHLNNFENY